MIQRICYSSTGIVDFIIKNHNFRTLLQTMQAPNKAQSSAQQIFELGNISVAVKKIFSSLPTLEKRVEVVRVVRFWSLVGCKIRDFTIPVGMVHGFLDSTTFLYIVIIHY